MSTNYFVDLTLKAEYSKENIKKILQQGENLGFSYYDASQTIGENDIVASAYEASELFFRALNDNYNNGSILRIKLKDEQSCGFLDFYKTLENTITVSLGGFGEPHMKAFSKEILLIDFDYYIRLALDLCKDFAVTDIKIESI